MVKKDYPYCLAFDKIQGLGPIKTYSIFQYFGSFEEAWNGNILDFKEIKNLNEKNIKDIFEVRKKLIPEQEFEKLNNANVNMITLNDDEYPALLKKIHDPPFIIFYKGLWDTELFDRCVGIVGTRTPSYSGKKIAFKFGYELSMYNITVASGLALGIDTEAHKGVLQCNKGKTIAVLGCGADIVYPASNKKIYDQIAESGLIISEYPPYTQPDVWRFPARNRIISGISKGVLLIEAGEKSGALITTDFALEQGRDVMATPGDILNKMSIGANNLIKQGAGIITSGDDIMECLGWRLDLNKNERKKILEKKESDTINGNENRNIYITNIDGIERFDLTPDEKEIYSILEETPIHLDIISNKLDLPLSSISGNLIMLELKSLVKQLPGKLFVRI